MKKKIKPLITLIAGGTGGHVFPAISISNYLERKFDFSIITDKRGANFLLKSSDFIENKNKIDLKTINTISPFKSGFFNKFVFVFLGIIAAFEILLFFLKKRSELIISFGGYSTVIPCLIAKLLGIKYIIHEQNALIGRANKLLEYFSEYTLVSFEKNLTAKPFKKRVFCGTPIRQSFYQDNLRKNKNSKDKFNILIIGGSLGSDFFSTQLPKFFFEMEIFYKKKIYVNHQVINSKKAIVKKKYLSNNISANVKSFFPNISALFKEADLIISRSGGSAIAEIIASKIPSIIIPLPNSLDNHQYENSLLIKEKQIGWVFEEKYIDKQNFTSTLIKIISDENLKKKINQNFEKLHVTLRDISNKKTPEKIVYEIVENIINKKNR